MATGEEPSALQRSVAGRNTAKQWTESGNDHRAGEPPNTRLGPVLPRRGEERVRTIGSVAARAIAQHPERSGRTEGAGRGLDPRRDPNAYFATHGLIPLASDGFNVVVGKDKAHGAWKSVLWVEILRCGGQRRVVARYRKAGQARHDVFVAVEQILGRQIRRLGPGIRKTGVVIGV